MEIKDLIKIDKICYENKKGFIYCLVFVQTFFCFVNYGEHIINNKSNNNIRNYFIKDITKVKTSIITIDDEFDNFELNENLYIIFKDIKGINQLLDGKKRQIKKVGLINLKLMKILLIMKIILEEEQQRR